MKEFKCIILSTVQLVVAAPAFAHDGRYGMWPGMMGWGHSQGWPTMIFMFLFSGAVLAGIVALIRLVLSKGGPDVSQPAESALDILKKRYARGEIDKEEFEEKKRVIEE